MDTLQPDPRIAAHFYGALLGWQFDAPRPMPGGLEGQYLVARLGGLAVAGISQAPSRLTTAIWTTHIRVDSIGATIWRLPGYTVGQIDQPMPRDVVAVMAPIQAPGADTAPLAVNFKVKDLDRVAARATDLGGTIVVAPKTTPGFRSAVIADPGQGVIAISAPRE